MLFYIIILFLFPISVSIYLNLDKDEEKNEEVYNDLRFIGKFMCDLTWPLLVIFFVKFYINGDYSEPFIKLIFFDVLSFFLLIALIVYVNYFGTRYDKFRICIKTFLNVAQKFLNENFVLNLLFFSLIVFVNKDNGLTIGLVGAYLFFALDKIHTEYKRNIGNKNMHFGGIYKFGQAVLNILILFVFVGIEHGLSRTFQGLLVNIELKCSIYLMLLSLVIIINWLLSDFELFVKKSRK